MNAPKDEPTPLFPLRLPLKRIDFGIYDAHGKCVADCISNLSGRDDADAMIVATNAYDAFVAALEPLARIEIPEDASGHDTVGYANGGKLIYVSHVRAARSALKACGV